MSENTNHPHHIHFPSADEDQVWASFSGLDLLIPHQIHNCPRHFYASRVRIGPHEGFNYGISVPMIRMTLLGKW